MLNANIIINISKYSCIFTLYLSVSVATLNDKQVTAVRVAS
jgi:hypothetical protein